MIDKIVKEELVNNSNQLLQLEGEDNSNDEIIYKKPSKKLLKTLRRESIDGFIMFKIEELIQNEEWMEEITELLSDEEFLYGNFPYYSVEQVEKYMNEFYTVDSRFLRRLKKFLRKEELRTVHHSEKLSDDEKDFLEFLSL